MDIQVVVSITIDDKFVQDSIINMGYEVIPANGQHQERFFKKIRRREEINGICDIKKKIRGISGVLRFNYIHPAIYKKPIKWYFHPIMIIIYLAIVNTLALLLMIRSIETEYKIAMIIYSKISILVISTIIYIIVEFAKFKSEKLKDG